MLISNCQLGWPLGSELQRACLSYAWYHFQVGHTPLWVLQTKDSASCLCPFSGCPSEAAELGKELLNSLLSNENDCGTENITRSQGSERARLQISQNAQSLPSTELLLETACATSAVGQAVFITRIQETIKSLDQQSRPSWENWNCLPFSTIIQRWNTSDAFCCRLPIVVKLLWNSGQRVCWWVCLTSQLSHLQCGILLVIAYESWCPQDSLWEPATVSFWDC